MNYYYDEEHIWPSEKLYRYLIKKYFEGNKNFMDGDLRMVRVHCLSNCIRLVL